MPEFKETPNENAFNLSDVASELAELSRLRAMAMDTVREHGLGRGRGFIEFESDVLTEPVEALNETESEPKFASSAEKLSHTLDSIHDPATIGQFEQVVANMKDAATSERDKEDIRHFGEYNLWAMKGYDAEPPESVVAIRHASSPLLKIERNPQVFTDADEDRIFNKYDRESKINKATWPRIQGLYDNDEKVKGCLEEIVSESPVYKFLESLSIESPHDPEDRPLNNLERAVREAQATHETKRQFGMEPNDNIRAGTDAARVLQRKTIGLDDERIAEKTINSADRSIEPIKRYLADTVRTRLPDNGWDNGLEDEPFELAIVGNFYTLRSENPALEEIDIPTIHSYKLARVVRESFGSEGLDGRIDELTVRNAILGIVRREFETSEQLLDFVQAATARRIYSDEVTLDHSAPSITKPLTGIKIYDQETYDREEKAHNASREALERAESSYNKALENAAERAWDWSFGLQDHTEGPKTASELINAPDFDIDSSFVFDTKESIEKDEAKAVGTVVGFESDGINRLIQATDKNRGLPPAKGSADLVFVTDNAAGFVAQDPQIPGYELSAHTNDVYEFTKGQHDPYVDCGVAIPPDGRQALAEEYQVLGLTKLSQDVLRADQFTVSDLAKAIQGNSEYYVPSEIIRVSEDPEFADFQPFVKDSKVQLQCSGASHFLKLSLNKVFGESTSEVVNGLSFADSGQVTLGSTHGQTQFEHNGETYILDATPDRASSELAGQMEMPKPEVIVEQTPEEKLNLQFERLERNLTAVFKTASTRELHTMLSALPDHDPSRQALEITAGLKSSQEAADFQEYLSELKQAVTNKDSRLKQLGIGKYSVEMLDLLSNQVKVSQDLLVTMGR
jgi:hypothetical protein